MIINYSLLPYILGGIVLITMLNTAGSVASRKFNFNYGFLSPVSFAIYTVVGYLVSRNNPLDIAVACNVLIGMFDASVGWYLSMKLKANTGSTEEHLIEMTAGKRIIAMGVIASVFAMIGYMIVNNMTI